MRRAWSLDLGGNDRGLPTVHGFLAGPAGDDDSQNPPPTDPNANNSSGYATGGTDQPGPSLMDLLGIDPCEAPYLLDNNMYASLGAPLPWSREGAQDSARAAKARDSVPTDLWQAIQGGGGSMNTAPGVDAPQQQAVYLPSLSSVPQFLVLGTPVESLRGLQTAGPSMAAPAGGQETAFTMDVQRGQAPQQPSVSGYPQRSPGSTENLNALQWLMQPPPAGPARGAEGPSATSTRSWPGSGQASAVWGQPMGEGVDPWQAPQTARQYSWLCNCETPDQLTGLNSPDTEVRWTGMPRMGYLPSDQGAGRATAPNFITPFHPHGAHSRFRKERGLSKTPQCRLYGRPWAPLLRRRTPGPRTTTPAYRRGYPVGYQGTQSMTWKWLHFCPTTTWGPRPWTVAVRHGTQPRERIGGAGRIRRVCRTIPTAATTETALPARCASAMA